MKLAKILSSTFLILCMASCWAQNNIEPLNYGHTETFYSKILDKNKTLAISLPDNYESSNETYPLVIFLDGLGNAKLTFATHNLFKYAEFVPNSVLVGIQPVDRNNHYLPWKTERIPNGGGANGYLKFIEEELIPYLESTCRIHKYRILVGTSFGGLFVLHALMSKPELFDCYLAISPSCWYNNGEIIKKVKDFFNNGNDLSKKYLFLSVANEGIRMGVDNFADTLKTTTTNLNWEFEHYPYENHRSAPYKSTGDGLKFFYKNWSPNPPTIEPKGDVILAGNSIKVKLKNEKATTIRYTLNGTEPTSSSPEYSDLIEIKNETILKAKTFYDDGKIGLLDSAVFKIDGYHEAIKDLPNLVNGLKYEYYEGEWKKIPDFSTLERVNSGTCSMFDISSAKKEDNFAFVFTGYIKIPSDDKYTFYLSSDDGSQLFINGKLVINHDFNHIATEKQAKVFLKAGMHPIKIKYYEASGGQELRLIYESKDIKKQPVNSEILFREK